MGVGKSVEILPCDDTSVVSGQHTIALRFDKTILADGFKGLLQFVPEFLAHLRRHAAGTKVLATNRAFIMSAEVLLPPPTEQAAIATLISELETEITALQSRRDKTHAIKQAMMHELLTGRTRLV
jgi:type I restriction enzyme S subunit